jgi:DNA-directed RNA polymerase specialized sigma24 family protein
MAMAPRLGAHVRECLRHTSAMQAETVAAWEHWDAMVRAAHGVLGEADGARECAAEAMVQFLEAGDLGEVRNLEAFLVTVSKRRAVDRIRRIQRQRARELRVVGGESLSTADIAEDVAHRAHANWVDEQARRVLQPEVYRLLCLVADGCSAADAAARLGMTARGAEGHLNRARMTLRGVIARAALGWAAILGLGRRLSVRSAGATATMATVVLALMLAPAWSASDAEQPAIKPTPHVAASAPAGPVEPSVGSTAGGPGPRASASFPHPGTSRSVDVRTPLGGVAIEDRDDGSDADYLTRLLTCLQHPDLRLPPDGELGCVPDQP